jgi:hypothetical protein
MKELDDFTVERLEQLINFAHENGTLHAIRTEWQALAKIALAVKSAEPVAWQLTHIDGRVIIERDKRIADLFEMFNGNVCMPLYAAPVLNSPELPDGWIPCAERMPVDCQAVLCNNMLTELSGIPFIADYVGMFELYDGTRYEAGFYINRTPQTVTHWMPLPATPTTEK